MESPATPPGPESEISGCFFRIFWAMLGPVLLAGNGLAILVHDLPLGSIADFIFAGILAGVLTARSRDRMGSAGSPASTSVDNSDASKRKYMIGITVFGCLFFLLAHLFGGSI